MRLSWIELSQILSDKLSENDYHNLTPLLENVQALNESYATKPLYFDRIDSCVKELSALVADNSATKEQLTKKMKTLCDDMQDVVKSGIKPLMYNQFWFMDRMNALGYKIIGLGECYGMSYMATQAFLANDMETFNKRLQTIYEIPIDDFNNDFAHLREKIQQLLDEGKEDKADDITKQIVDFYAFFDGVALNQRPNIYLHDEDNQPISKKQDIRKTMLITMPIALETDENKPSIIDAFTGYYNEKDLTDYLNLLKNELGNNLFSLNLIGFMHAITVAYDAKTERWLLIDPANLPGEEYIRSEHLAKAVFDDFTSTIKRGVLVMGTQIITTAQYAEPMQLQFENLKTNTRWVALHDPEKLNKADILGFTPSTLYDRFYENSKDIKWDDQQVLDSALKAGLNDVIIRLATTKGAEPFLNIDAIKLRAVLLALPLEQQQTLLNQLPVTKKADIIGSDYNSVYERGFFQMLPEQDQLPVFLKLSSAAQGALLDELAEEALAEQRNRLFQALTIDQKADIIGSRGADFKSILFQLLPEQERLPVFTILKPGSQRRCLQQLLKEGKLEQKNIFLQHLSIDQKVQIIASASHGNDLGAFFQMLLEQERLSVFIKLAPRIQALYLSELTKAALTEQRNTLIKNLSVDQKANIILDGYEIGRDSSWNKQKLNEMVAFFQMLSEQERLAIFLKFSPNSQGNFLLALTKEGATEQRDVLFNQLSVEQKSDIITHSASGKNDIFQLLHEQERLPVFLKLGLTVQSKFMAELTEDVFPELGNPLLEQLTNKQKIDIITHFPEYSGFKSFVLIFNSLPKNMYFEILQEKTASFGNVLSYVRRDSICLFQIMASLNADERFNLIRDNIYRFEDMPLRSLKKILQDKIMGTEPASRFIFDDIKQHIANAENVYQLADLLEQLNQLLEHPLTMAMVVADISALALDNEGHDSAVIKYPALNNILESLGLTKDTLTSSSLKKVWRKIHPDKITVDKQTLDDATANMNVLKIFTSMSGLVDYKQDREIQANVRNRLSGITKEDELFLIHTGAETIKKQALEARINAAVVNGVNRFININVEDHKNGLQSFETTLNMLSKAANILDNPSEHEAFLNEAKQRIDGMEVELHPDDVSARYNQMMIKAGINQFRADTEDTNKGNESRNKNSKNG